MAGETRYYYGSPQLVVASGPAMASATMYDLSASIDLSLAAYGDPEALVLVYEITYAGAVDSPAVLAMRALDLGGTGVDAIPAPSWSTGLGQAIDCAEQIDLLLPGSFPAAGTYRGTRVLDMSARAWRKVSLYAYYPGSVGSVSSGLKVWALSRTRGPT